MVTKAERKDVISFYGLKRTKGLNFGASSIFNGSKNKLFVKRHATASFFFEKWSVGTAVQSVLNNNIIVTA